MERVQFFGSAFFIPIFLVSVGILLNPKVLFDPRTLLVALVFTVAVLGGKALAAVIAGRVFHFTWPEIGVMSGLSGSQAAATLATTLVGTRLGVFDERTVNAVLVRGDAPARRVAPTGRQSTRREQRSVSTGQPPARSGPARTWRGGAVRASPSRGARKHRPGRRPGVRLETRCRADQAPRERPPRRLCGAVALDPEFALSIDGSHGASGELRSVGLGQRPRKIGRSPSSPRARYGTCRSRASSGSRRQGIRGRHRRSRRHVVAGGPIAPSGKAEQETLVVAPRTCSCFARGTRRCQKDESSREDSVHSGNYERTLWARRACSTTTPPVEMRTRSACR